MAVTTASGPGGRGGTWGNIQILFDDKLKMNLTTELKEGDLPEQLTNDLVTNGLVNEVGQVVGGASVGQGRRWVEHE